METDDGVNLGDPHDGQQKTCRRVSPSPFPKNRICRARVVKEQWLLIIERLIRGQAVDAVIARAADIGATLRVGDY